MKNEKQLTFKEFKQFLTEKCFDEKKYGEGKYDRKIYNWFDFGKPKKVEFLTADGKFKKFNKK